MSGIYGCRESRGNLYFHSNSIHAKSLCKLVSGDEEKKTKKRFRRLRALGIVQSKE